MPVIELFNAQGPFGIADVDHDIGDMTILTAGCLLVIGTHGGNQGCRYLFGIPNLVLNGEGVDGFGGDFLNKGLEAILIAQGLPQACQLAGFAGNPFDLVLNSLAIIGQVRLGAVCPEIIHCEALIG